MIESYCCDSLKARDRSIVRHGAGKQHPCAKYHSTHEDQVMDKNSSNRTRTGAVELQKNVKNAKVGYESGKYKRYRKAADKSG